MKKYPKAKPNFKIKKAHRKLIKQVRALLKGRHESCICPALERSVNIMRSRDDYDPAMVVACRELKSYVMGSLDNVAYLHSWQRDRGLFTTHDDARKARRKWMKSLLAL